jgi:sugar lactone lactonase YvrE
MRKFLFLFIPSLLIGMGNSLGQVVIGGSYNILKSVAAGPSGNLYATSQGGQGVVIINGTDESVKIFGQNGTANGQFANGSPAGIAIDASEKIYVADRGNNRIQVFDKNGNFLSVQTGFNFPNGIDIDGTGKICVVEEGAHGFKLFNSSFGLIKSMGGAVGSGNGQFNSPEGVSFDQFGNFFIADRNNFRIQKFNSAGDFVLAFGTSGTLDGQFSEPTSVKVYNSEVYVSDATNRLQVFDLNGVWKRKAAYPAEGSYFGIAFTATGNLVLASSGSERIAIYNPAGTLIKSYGSKSSADGGLNYPSGIARLSNGDIVTSEFVAGSRVQIFTSAGVFKSKFSVPGNIADVDVHKPTNNIYVLTATDKKVHRFSSSGVFLASINIPDITSATRMSIDKDGNIWLLLATAPMVRKYDGNTTGAGVGVATPLLQFGTQGNLDGQFGIYLGDIAIDQVTNNVYVASGSVSNDGKIQVFDNATGAHKLTWSELHHTLIAIDGTSLISWESDNTCLVKHFSLNNVTLAHTLLNTTSGKGLSIGLNSGLNDLDFDAASGQLGMSDYLNNRVQVLTLSPEIAVAQAGANIVSGSTYDVGGLAVNTPKQFLFTISSQGVQPIMLSGTPKVSIAGANATDFAIDQTDLNATITGNSSFKIIFTPSATGTRTATISIPNNDADEGPFTFTITGKGKANQTIDNFTSLPVKMFGDANFNLTATSSSSLPVTYQSTNPSVATIVGNIVTITGAGITTITATQIGNDSFFEVSKSLIFTVNKANQIITFATLADKTIGDAAFALSATSSSNLTVNFSSTSDKISITGSQVTIVKAGRAIITAAQTGNANYNVATSVDRSFCIKPAKPIITLSNNNTESPTLTSSATAGNQWFLNGTAISGATNATYNATAAGVYKVQVKVDDCVSEFSLDQALIVTGDIAVTNSLALHAYPNPTQDYLVIEGISHQVQGKVTNLLGANQTIRQELKDGRLLIYVSELTPGVYVLQVQGPNQTRVLRFIKQ